MDECECVNCCCSHRPSCSNLFHQAGWEGKSKEYKDGLIAGLRGQGTHPLPWKTISPADFIEGYARGFADRTQRTAYVQFALEDGKIVWSKITKEAPWQPYIKRITDGGRYEVEIDDCLIPAGVTRSQLIEAAKAAWPCVIKGEEVP